MAPERSRTGDAPLLFVDRSLALDIIGAPSTFTKKPTTKPATASITTTTTITTALAQLSPQREHLGQFLPKVPLELAEIQHRQWQAYYVDLNLIIEMSERITFGLIARSGNGVGILVYTKGVRFCI